MRVALFSEVYWPMVSGVGVTLVRLVDALKARGHTVRVYSATYELPAGAADRPEVHRSPSIPLFLYPDVQWAFPRYREVLAAAARRDEELQAHEIDAPLGVGGRDANGRNVGR